MTAGTTSRELERLATHPDPQVRCAVAAHPNTPPGVLRDLAPECPGEVLGNRGLPLLRLAQPRLIQDWPKETLLRLIRHDLAPDWLRRFAVGHPRSEFQVALASNRVLSEAEVTGLAAHSAWQVRAKIAARPELPPAVLSTLSADADYGVRLYVAARRDLPQTSVERLRRDPSLFVRQVLEQTQRA
ncbi:hypothetical protein [Deinococcus koreensis]|uniref:Leucine rich repeat variant n=1 Tax=Deinococcus koreensis TaxID=2054903 RepID=A0A2K3UVA8_9DEIO|nr:hypothetical protein [Deinococcus koreensis]PNY80462.1 hypothetical protein CVO96_02945 [Deinococcus koreensis]